MQKDNIMEKRIVMGSKMNMNKSMTMGNEMKRKMSLRILFSVLAIAVMAFAADLLNEKEVIFPEVAALAIGLWIADKRIWNVQAYQVPLLMTISAVLGVLITTYLAVPILLQLTVAFFISAFLMSVLRIPLIPGIAAILLPVLLHTESWLYPLSVAVMTTIMAVGYELMQKYGLKSQLNPVASREGLTVKALRTWLIRFLMLLPLFAVATWKGWLFAIVPPLVIILIELTNPKNMFRNRPITLWFTVIAVAAIGTLSRFLLMQTLAFPYFISVSLAFLLSVLLMRRLGLMFPPIPALSVIPFILPSTYFYFPLEVAFGAAYAITVPLLKSRFASLVMNKMIAQKCS